VSDGAERGTSERARERSTAVKDEKAERRLAALERYGVLEGETPPALKALVDLASRVAGVPMATINLHTDTEQVQVETVGFRGTTSPREDSMCIRVVSEARPILVPDASADDRYRDNPFVTGELAEVRFYGSHPLRTPDDVVIGTLCVFDDEARPVDPQMEAELRVLADRIVDVLELDLTSRRLAAANEQLTWANEALGAFAGQVSHDLKNPLAAVIMSLGLALEEIGDHPARDLVERAGRSAQRMSAMIGDLLDFAGGRVSDVREPIDLRSVVADVVEDLGPALEGADVVVGDLPIVHADPAPIRVVVQNLLANAAKFARPGLTTRIEVAGYRTDRFWRLEVSDNGRGIPVAERKRVLEPLVRLDRTVPGSGIGLATCARIVAGHGGILGLGDGLPAADGDHGTMVWLEVPVG
jgi:signal transduction histidine kinase